MNIILLKLNILEKTRTLDVELKGRTVIIR